MEYSEFRGMARSKVSASKSDFIIRLCQLLPLRKLPPREILNEYLSQGRVDRGMSGGLAWAPFQCTKIEYDEIVLDARTIPIEVPASVKSGLEWEAWCYHIEFHAPYEEILTRLQEVNDLENEWNRALQKEKSSEEDEIHLRYIRASNALDAFLDQHNNTAPKK